MIYTIGHRESYLAAIAQKGSIKKIGKRLPGEDERFQHGYPGGYAFRTYEDALEGLEEENSDHTWCVFGLDADWDTDTEPSAWGWWHNLLRDTPIIVIEETPQ